MAFRFSAGRSTSFLLTLLASRFIGAQAFGRFGYTQSPSCGGFTISRSGLTVNATGADSLKFLAPSSLWRPVETSDKRQTVLLNGGFRRPGKLRMDLFSAGPELYFDNGFELDVDSLGSPYLSWAEGSTGDGVPTPELQSVLLSYRNDQPPILLVVLGSPKAFIVRGKPGAWRIQSSGEFTGWIRLVLPCGLEPVATPNASRLARLWTRVDKYLPDWTRAAPQSTGPTLTGDTESVTATWRFGGRGAVIPAALALAPEAGYPLQISPKLRILDGSTEGPRFVLDDRILTIRFPVKRVPNGRAVCLGPLDLEPPATLSPLDLEGVIELALANLCGARPDASRKLGDDLLAQFLSDADYVKEPFTGQQLPFTADGSGADLVAAHALLMQALSLSTRTDSDSNSLLTSLAWRRDAYNLLIDLPNASLSRRASAIAAVASALCPEPQRRFEAALLQAGLTVDAYLAARQGRTVAAEPLAGIRSALFALRSLNLDPFAAGLRSPLRVFGPEGVTATKESDGVLLTWISDDGKPGILTLASAYSAKIENVDLKSVEISSAIGLISIKYAPRVPGPCHLKLKFPPGSPALPSASPPKAR